MNLEWLILEKKVKETDEAIQRLAVESFTDRIVPNWLPPEWGKERIKISIAIDHLTDESIDKFQKELRRLIGIRNTYRSAQAKKKLDMDLTKIHETVPT